MKVQLFFSDSKPPVSLFVKGKACAPAFRFNTYIMCFGVSRPWNGTRPKVVLNSTGRDQQAVNVYFYFLFVLHHGGEVYLLLATS